VNYLAYLIRSEFNVHPVEMGVAQVGMGRTGGVLGRLDAQPVQLNGRDRRAGGGEAAVASSFVFLVFAWYGQSCGADRFGGFRSRRDRLRGPMGAGQGKTPEPNPRTGTFIELPQNWDTLCNDAWGRPVPIPWEFYERPGSGVLTASDGFRSSCAKAPFPGAFAFSAEVTHGEIGCCLR